MRSQPLPSLLPPARRDSSRDWLYLQADETYMKEQQRIANKYAIELAASWRRCWTLRLPAFL